MSDDGEEKISEAGVYSIVSMVLGIFLFNDSASPARLGCVALIVAGVIGLKLVSTP